MTPGTRNVRWPIALLAVLVFLFAPASDEGRMGATRGAQAPLDARILAPTFREAVVAVGPKVTSLQHQVVTRQSQPDPVGLAVGPAALAILFLLASLAGVLLLRGGPRLLAFPPQTPRGPPVLRTV